MRIGARHGTPFAWQVIVALACGALFASPAFGQTISIGLDATTSRALPAAFYGANGQQRNSEPWDQSPSPDQPLYNPGFPSALEGLHYGILRFPAGTGGNYWDWQTGDFVSNYLLTNTASPPSPYPSPLSELESELGSAAQVSGAQINGDFVLNALSDPLCVPAVGSQDCSFTPASPDEAYQLQLLASLAQQHINVASAEIGNEYYLTFPDYENVYATAQAYATLANKWATDMHTMFPTLKVAAVGAHCASCGSGSRMGNWDSGLMSVLTVPDAVVIHLYTPSGLASGTAVTNTSAATMLLTPFQQWAAVVANDFPALATANYTPNVWFTEFNLKDDTVSAGGTWAHGLYLATYDLLFATNSRVTMALHHETQDATEGDPDIFAGANGFSNYSLKIATALDGYTASGLTTREINTAALGQAQAEALTFPGAPMLSGSTQPVIIGELFSGGSVTQAILLNLDSAPHAVDLSGVIGGGTFRQIYGEAGAYVDGNTTAGGFEAWDDVNPATPANLTLTTDALVANSLTLQPFSITRVMATAPTTTTVSSSANPSTVGQSVTFTATVSSSGGTPSGAVNFLDGATQIGSGTLNGSGQATFATASLAQGSHSITASYAGNSSFAASVSAVLAQVVNAAPVPSFSLSISPGSQSVTPGQSTSYTLTLTPVNGFNQAVTIACSGAPAATTCAPASSPVTLNGTSASQVQMNVATTAASLALRRNLPILLVPAMTLAVGSLLGMLCMWGAVGMQPLTLRYRLGLLLVAMAAALAAAGCGSGSSGSGKTGSNGTPAGAYTLRITGTSGTLSQSATVTLTVN
jgi:hypothetical protein